MFDSLKARVHPDKFKSAKEKEQFTADIKNKLMSMFPDNAFRLLFVPQFSQKNIMMKITDWKKELGDKVDIDDVVASCETRKAQFDLSSAEKGILIFRIDKGKELMRDDIYGVLADTFVDLGQFKI